jgi:cell division protein FtsB
LSDQTPVPSPWWVPVLAALEKFIKDNWSGLAVILYSYEEQKVDHAKQEEKTAELKEKLAENESEIRKANSGKSALDIIDEQLKRSKSGSD